MLIGLCLSYWYLLWCMMVGKPKYDIDFHEYICGPPEELQMDFRAGSINLSNFSLTITYTSADQVKQIINPTQTSALTVHALRHPKTSNYR